jgi:hypothetical protein
VGARSTSPSSGPCRNGEAFLEEELGFIGE